MKTSEPLAIIIIIFPSMAINIQSLVSAVAGIPLLFRVDAQCWKDGSLLYWVRQIGMTKPYSRNYRRSTKLSRSLVFNVDFERVFSQLFIKGYHWCYLSLLTIWQIVALFHFQLPLQCCAPQKIFCEMKWKRYLMAKNVILNIPPGIYLFKVNYKNTRTICEICLELIM